MPEPEEYRFLRAIIGDVIEAEQRNRQTPSDETRRTLIRAIAAGLEGLAWQYKTEVLDIVSTVSEVHIDTRLALADETLSIDDRGRIRRQAKPMSACAIIRCTANIVEAIEPGHSHDFSDSQWNILLTTVKMRNAITHPKSLTDLDVSEDSVNAAFSAFQWVFEMIVSDLEICGDQLRNHSEELRFVADRLLAGDSHMLAIYHAVHNHIDDD